MSFPTIFGATYKNLARQDFQQREQIVSISEILEEVADIAAGLEREGKTYYLKI